MGPGFRVFGSSDSQPEAAGMEACLAGLGEAWRLTFQSSQGEWFAAELSVGSGEPVFLERYWSDEEGIRAELNSWAAFLETCTDSPNHAGLMERTIQTRQLFTLCKPPDHAGDERFDSLCLALCRHLAKAVDGFYQVDGAGFFAADGTLLVEEP